MESHYFSLWGGFGFDSQPRDDHLWFMMANKRKKKEIERTYLRIISFFGLVLKMHKIWLSTQQTMQISDLHQRCNSVPIADEVECCVSWANLISRRPFPVGVLVLCAHIVRNDRWKNLMMEISNFFVLNSLSAANFNSPLVLRRFHWDENWIHFVQKSLKSDPF